MALLRHPMYIYAARRLQEKIPQIEGNIQCLQLCATDISRSICHLTDQPKIPYPT